MLQADTEGYYTITAKTSSAIEIINSVETYDTFFKSLNNCYNYYVRDPHFDLRVRMKVYGGNPDLYINPKTADKELKKFKYSSYETLESEELVITPEMREDDQNVVGQYFICVFGAHTSSYRLDVHNDDKSTHMLESGVSESGYLKNNEITNFWFRDNILTSKTNITFQLHAMSGKLVLRYKQCPVEKDLEKAKENCVHNLEDLTKPIKNEKSFYGIGAETIEHDPSNCTIGNINSIRNREPRCMYNIGVLGSAENIISHYGVTIRHQEFMHGIIAEGEMIEGSIVQKQYNYYKISISDARITSLSIQLLAIHGNPDLYVSRNETFPKTTNFEKKATICGRFPDTVQYRVEGNDTHSPNLTGNYYIAVYGFTDSTYHLYYHTERINDDNVTTTKLPVRLSQNKPIRGVLTNKTDYLKYKFTVNNITSDEEVFIKLVPQNGKFRFFTKYNDVADNTNYDLYGDSTNHYTVSYGSSYNKTFSKGTFYVYVQPAGTEDLESTGMSYTFLINFFIGSHHITLLDDQQTLGHTRGDDVNYYTYSYKNSTNNIWLSLTQVNGNIETIISLNHSIPTPTNNDVNEPYGVFTAYRENTTIPETDITKFCSAPAHRHCKMYIAIHAMDTSRESSYVIFAKALNNDDKHIFKIENSVPVKGSLKEDEWAYYYFKTSSHKPVYAVTVPVGGDPNVYVSLINDTSLKQSEWTLPTKENYLKTSQDSIGADILMLSKNDLKECYASCILVFGVNSHNYASSYSFTVNRGIVILKEKEAYTDTLGSWGNYKFYDYYRSCKGCTTIISVNSLSNHQFNVFINFNTTTKVSSHQDPSSVDYPLRGRGSQEIRITPEDLKRKNHSDSQGYFSIEVHSHSDLNYTISVSSDKVGITSIDKGMWASYNLRNETDSKAFIYKHNSKKKFYITIQPDVGPYPDVFVNPAPAEIIGDYSQYLPTRENHVWNSSLNEDLSNTEIDPKDVEICKDCYYVISLNSYGWSTGSIAIQEASSQESASKITTLKLGKPVRHNMRYFTFSYYKFIVDDNEDVIVDVNVLSGSVEYKLTNYPLKEENYDDVYDQDGDENGLIYHEYNPELYFDFSKNNSYFSVGKAFYITFKSNEYFSRFIVSVSHKGQYNHISDSTPLRVHMNKGEQMFYYTFNPESEKTRIVIETFLKNRDETFQLFAKLVPAEDTFKQDRPSEAPEWQAKFHEVEIDASAKINYTGSTKDKLYTSLYFDKNETERDKVLLIGVRPLNSSGRSIIDIYVSSSDIQPLGFDMMHSGYVENKRDKFKLYEVLVPHTKDFNYVVEATPCYGQIEMYITKSFAKMLDDRFEAKADHLINGRLTSILENTGSHSRRFTIAIKSTNGQFDEYKEVDFSDFQIEARKYPKDVAHGTYIERYHIPNDGVIEHSFTENYKILLEWPRVFDSQDHSKMLPESMVQYRRIVRTDTYPGMDSICYMSIYDNDTVDEGYDDITQNENSGLINIEDFGEEITLYVSVYAYIDEKKNSDNLDENYYTMAYKPIKIPIPHMGDDHGLLLWIMLFIAIILS